jgi:hypothetical protein
VILVAMLYASCDPNIPASAEWVYPMLPWGDVAPPAEIPEIGGLQWNYWSIFFPQAVSCRMGIAICGSLGWSGFT